ncbi:MAG: general secretion pathway protein GspK, partial [Lentisphaeria bacterium]|nr:general secretion pathway protein GspK [Lentisphaeria bacterium]
MIFCRHAFKRKRSEQGSALVAALCLIFMAGMLTATVLALSRIATFDVHAHVELQRSAYINEGIASRIQFLLAADRNVNPSGSLLGELDYEEYEHDRYTADGIAHLIDYHGTEVRVVIHDAASGFNLNSSSYRRTLQSIVAALELEDNEISGKMETLTQRITDYIDSNDGPAGEDGMEAGEYEAENLAPLPRNGNFRYREELLFIPGITEFFKPDRYGILSCIRLITPYGMADISRNSTNPAFFAADRLLLKVQG